MRILNRAYEVLSDPEQRAVYDRTIELSEAEIARGTSDEPKPSAAPRKEPVTANSLRAQGLGFLLFGLGLAAFIGLASLFEHQTSSGGWKPYETSSNRTYDRSLDRSAEALSPEAIPSAVSDDPIAVVALPTPAAEAPTAKAPNGSPWPSGASYIAGYPRLHSGGLSTVTVDNSANSTDVFVKLFSLDYTATRPVRQFFIPAHGQFTARNLTPGEYDVRYMDLSDGSLARSESFALVEQKEEGSTRYSNIKMTLYTVPGGNMQTYPLKPSEFE